MKKTQLTGYELTLISSTIRNLIDKENTISYTFPSEFIKNSYHRMKKEEKEGLLIILNNCLRWGQVSLVWDKLRCLLDEKNRKIIEIKGNKIECFCCLGKYYPIEAYLQFPEKELPIEEKFIKI